MVTKRVLLAAMFLLAATPAFAQQIEGKAGFKGCTDGSLDKALADGITLGISPSPPYSNLDPNTKKADGLDVELNEAALHWLGIDNIKYEVAPFGQLIPMLLSNRIDVVASNIHQTPDRLKVVTFTGPAWWYGPALVTQKGNPAGIKSFDDLKGKKVGAIAGSAADEYLRSVGIEVTPFQEDAAEFAGISTGKVDVILEDDVKVLDYIKANADSPIEIVAGVAVPEELIFKYGYGYARYAVRPADCQLRMAYGVALHEIWGAGIASEILKKYGLSNRNLTYFPLN
ncbi:transporter substrate-binding domain-containing protein [Aestuariivirga sp.]|uniref:transporter substrate-binding domain-containing protein n=1 Tax=Aestuariivirga sp. TaxID=2650926 RepID=UPI003BAA3CE7